jgi:deazaflavin-dependent oxidoreductase (nitroreductase family)
MTRTTVLSKPTVSRPVPHVDPSTPHGPLYRALTRALRTRLMLFFEHSVVWRILGWRLVPRAMRLTGRLTLRGPIPTGLLETTDSRNGRPHRRAVIYFHDGDRVTVIPSKAGLPGDPYWYLNALAAPEVLFGGQPFRAQSVQSEPERARLWALADQFYPPYASYRAFKARVGQTVPILQLIPR